jgi:predicted Zn-dependent peptidase
MNHPLGMSILGTGETVSGINKESILHYIKRFYTPDRIILSAAGGIDHEDLLGYFQPLFESLEPAREEYPRTMPDIHGGVLCHYKDTEQTHICLGGKAPHLSSDLRFAGAILNTILGGNMSSRLFQEIREKRGLAYAVYSFLSAYIDTGLLGVYVGTDPKDVNRVLRLINQEIRGIQQGDLSESDLAEAREHLIGGILLNAESPDTRMMRLAKNEYVFGRYMDFDEMVAQLEKVTLGEVIAVAGETFREQAVSLAVIGPVKDEDLDLDCLNFERIRPY